MHVFRLNIQLLLALILPLNGLLGQAKSAEPILSPWRSTLPFYDRLSKQAAPTHKIDSLFNWLVGTWSVKGKGYSKNGFKGKKIIEWTELNRDIYFDSDYTFYTSFSDSLVSAFKLKGKETISAIPRIFLQFDRRSNVWVLKGGYDWGSEIASNWTNTKVTFIGTISLEGLKITERQTWTKISNDEFSITYEEQLNDGKWFLSETNDYKRLP